MRVLVFFLLTLSVSSLWAAERFEFEEVHMGVPVRIVLYADAPEVADSAAKDAFERFRDLNKIMSDYDSDSELSRLSIDPQSRDCKAAVPLSGDLFSVMKSAKHFCTISDGAFDITVSPLVRLWRRSRRQGVLPLQRHIDQAQELVGNDLWELDDAIHSIRMLKPGMRFDLGGIAKGYAIDRAFEIVRKRGIESVLIDAGGDLRVGKTPPNEDGWKIRLDDKETIPLKNTAMATSGDRFQFVEIDGVRYSHIIDPKTGLGLTVPCTVHIIAPTATEADALASAVAVLGPEKGIKLIETLNGVSAKVILQKDNKTFQSKNWFFSQRQAREAGGSCFPPVSCLQPQ